MYQMSRQKISDEKYEKIFKRQTINLLIENNIYTREEFENFRKYRNVTNVGVYKMLLDYMSPNFDVDKEIEKFRNISYKYSYNIMRNTIRMVLKGYVNFQSEHNILKIYQNDVKKKISELRKDKDAYNEFITDASHTYCENLFGFNYLSRFIPPTFSNEEKKDMFLRDIYNSCDPPETRCHLPDSRFPRGRPPDPERLPASHSALNCFTNAFYKWIKEKAEKAKKKKAQKDKERNEMWKKFDEKIVADLEGHLNTPEMYNFIIKYSTLLMDPNRHKK